MRKLSDMLSVEGDNTNLIRCGRSQGQFLGGTRDGKTEVC